MASCTKCGATLIAKARFCATCGSPVAAPANAASSVAPTQSEKAVPDPFAKTVLGDDSERPRFDPPPQAVSPMAASIMANPPPAARPSQSPPAPARASQAPQRPSQSPPAAPPAAPPGAPPGYLGTPWNVAPLAPLPGASHAFTPGAMVLVYWADGNRYPGTVVQVAPHHVFVVFPNGIQQWIDARYVTPGR
jgi:hypothetical protein